MEVYGDCGKGRVVVFWATGNRGRRPANTVSVKSGEVEGVPGRVCAPDCFQSSGERSLQKFSAQARPLPTMSGCM